MKRGVATAALVLSSIAACRSPSSSSSSSVALTTEQCEALVDRFVALVVKETMPDASPERLRAEQARVKDEARRDPSLARCTTEISAAKHACAMAAPNADAFEKCLE